MDLFISHAHHDSELVRQLIDVIECALSVPEGAIRCTSLIDYRLNLGSIPREILSHDLSSTKCVIALITPHSLLSQWCQFELGAAWILSKNTIPVLAGSVGDSDIPAALRGAVSVHSGKPAELHSLIGQLSRNLGWTLRNRPSVNDKINALAQESAKDLGFSEHFLQKDPASEDRSLKQFLYNRQSVDYCRINKRIAGAKEVDLLSLVLRVARSQELEHFIVECVRNGGQVRILLSDPDGKPLALRQHIEGDGNNRIVWEIRDTLKFLGQIEERLRKTDVTGRFIYRLCRQVIYASIIRIDNSMLVTHYLNSKLGFDSPTLILSSQKGNGGLFTTYKEEFDCLWRVASS